MHLTWRFLRQFARYFLTSASDPGRNFNDKCVKCLNGLVSTTWRVAMPWSKPLPTTNCSKNLLKKNINNLSVVYLVVLPLLPTNILYFVKYKWIGEDKKRWPSSLVGNGLNKVENGWKVGESHAACLSCWLIVTYWMPFICYMTVCENFLISCLFCKLSQQEKHFFWQN